MTSSIVQKTLRDRRKPSNTHRRRRRKNLSKELRIYDVINISKNPQGPQEILKYPQAEAENKSDQENNNLWRHQYFKESSRATGHPLILQEFYSRKSKQTLRFLRRFLQNLWLTRSYNWPWIVLITLISTGNHMFLRVICEKSTQGFEKGFWNNRVIFFPKIIRKKRVITT